MRNFYGTAIVLVTFGLAGSAAGFECSSAGIPMYADCGMQGAYCSGACGAPAYGILVPGCCEHPPSCCDNVWAGYCAERARRRCFARAMMTTACPPMNDCITASNCPANVAGEVTRLPPVAPATPTADVAEEPATEEIPEAPEPPLLQSKTGVEKPRPVKPEPEPP